MNFLQSLSPARTEDENSLLFGLAGQSGASEHCDYDTPRGLECWVNKADEFG
jgi:hypothetical protein